MTQVVLTSTNNPAQLSISNDRNGNSTMVEDSADHQAVTSQGSDMVDCMAVNTYNDQIMDGPTKKPPASMPPAIH